MDKEHPIPQQISSYQFKLVGDMTIKQFFLVAGGALVAILFYSSGLPGFVKWPLIIASFLIGIAFAFFPLEDRPLQKWIYLFIKSIYSPTVFIWKQAQVQPTYFQPEPTQLPPKPLTGQAIFQPESLEGAISEEAIMETEETEKLEGQEQEILDKVEEQFTIPSTLPETINEPYLQTPVQQRNEVKVIKDTPVAIDVSEKGAQIGPTQSSTDVQTDTGYQVTPIATTQIQAARMPQFSQEASLPSSPTQANVVVGQVIDSMGKILENAILEIKDSEGRPVRALKSNRLGHFMIVTPLSDGVYEITTEKEGYSFEPIALTTKGEIVPPIVVVAMLDATGKNQTQTSEKNIFQSN